MIRVLSNSESFDFLDQSDVVHAIIHDSFLSVGDMALLLTLYSRLYGVIPDAGMIERYVSDFRNEGEDNG